MSLTLLENEPNLIITSYSELGLNNDTHPSTANVINIEVAIKEKRVFDDCLVHAIDEVFASLGPAVSHAFFEQLNNNFCINDTNLANRLEDFTKILHRVFGLGANRLELKILQVLKNQIQTVNVPECEYTVSKWIEMEVSFIDTLLALKRQYIGNI
jgi:hypothetical protein